jgi:short subunit dehydrogenase-like uncharacterized protein
MQDVLIYGAYGYTGELVARLAVERGLRPALGGRDASRLAALAAALGLEHRVFGLGAPGEIDRGLAGAKVVAHCAGPFAHTFRPMAQACVRAGVHYLDVTGEAAVLESLAAMGPEAHQRGVMLLPGAGFDVVPSDCLAAHLAARLPGAVRLALAFQGLTHASRGTALTMIENVARGGLVRRNGLLTRVPVAWRTRVVDLGAGPVGAVTIPWGDVATAFYSTGIPDIEVYMALPRARAAGLALRALAPLIGTGPAQRFLAARIRSRPAGPSAEERARSSMLLWGEVADAHGRTAAARMRTPDGYTLTASAMVAILERVLRGEVRPGFQTPSRAYGADLALSLPGVSRQDL